MLVAVSVACSLDSQGQRQPAAEIHTRVALCVHCAHSFGHLWLKLPVLLVPLRAAVLEAGCIWAGFLLRLPIEGVLQVRACVRVHCKL